MKLKFTADSKDWVMFGILAIILLYFVAIAVLNLAQFASGDIDHPFWGFNPFPAFGPNYIFITLVLYVVALVAIVVSVGDKFYDRDNGFGFSFGKKREKGYSRWLTEKELKEDKNIEKVSVAGETADAGGIPLINNGKTMWVDNGGYHSIIIGSTGAGKTQITMFPLIKSLAKHDESMIITDPKGELFEGTSAFLKKRGYNVIILNFRDPQKGSGWNPLHLPYVYYKNGNKDKANELIDDLAINILYDANAQNSDPFWEKTSADYFSGICLGLFDDADEKEINLNSVNIFTTVGEEKSGPNTPYVNAYFNTKDPSSPAYVSVSSTLISPNDTRGSILSVFKQKLRLFAARENVSEMLSHSDFEMDDIGSKKTAVFIVIQDEKKTYHPLVTIFVKQCYEALVDYAQRKGGKLPYRTNFLLDEFANMPPLKDVETMVSAARSRNMRFYFVIQNFAQLAEVYGKNKADTIRGNCGNTIYLISTELAALEEISKMCGEVKVKTGEGDKKKEETRPLITVSDLQKLKMGDFILLRSRLDPYKGKIKMDYASDWGEFYKTDYKGESAVYPDREKEEVHTFDLKGFVNKKKEEKINQIMGGNGKINASMKSPIGGTIKPASMFGNKSNGVKPSGFHIDSLLKKIDARIAELEAEEAAVKEKNKTDIKSMTSDAKSPIVSNIPMDEAFGNGIPIPQEIPITRKNTTSKKKTVSEAATEKTVISKADPVIKNITKEEDISTKHHNKIDTKEKKNTPIVHEIKKPSKKMNKSDFEAIITKKVNETLKKEDEKISKYNDDYVTDDQFFDDFFADDDDY